MHLLLTFDISYNPIDGWHNLRYLRIFDYVCRIYTYRKRNWTCTSDTSFPEKNMEREKMTIIVFHRSAVTSWEKNSDWKQYFPFSSYSTILTYPTTTKCVNSHVYEYKYRASQKNALSECCWNHIALSQSPFVGTPSVWRSRIKRPQVMSMVKFSPITLNFGYDFVLLEHFLWHPVYE